MTDRRVAVVTGAGQGIGLGIAAALAEDGATVVIVDRHEERARAAAATVGHDADGVVADVGHEAGVARLTAEVLDRHGRWDVLVNNAATLRTGALRDMAPADWDAVLHGCVTTAWLCTRAAADPMRLVGGGRIVNITSIVAQGAPSAGLAAYAAAKSAIQGLTLAAARELGPDGTTVNCVSPGAVVTDAWARIGDPEAMRAERAAASVLGRVAEPREIGEAVRYLASPAAGFVTGQTLVVDGGRTDKL
ncbi:MAG: SDR family oxidoreductase [Solirubrobacteraceae bacterium]|nr:SDR family oxidoreductase [Solirubrobacteraceae bacterium]